MLTYMDRKFLRVYHPFDITEVKDHVLIHGALSSSCGKCGELDLKLTTRMCPKCQTTFTYISFRNIKDHLPKLARLYMENPEIKFIDFDDYHKMIGANKAHDFFK